MITFSFAHKEDGYLHAIYTGHISDDELMQAWKTLFEDEQWVPTLNFLIDISQADTSTITREGIQRLAYYTQTILEKHGIPSIKAAVFAPRDLQFGLSRVYEALAAQSSETKQVFRSMSEAVAWLTHA